MGQPVFSLFVVSLVIFVCVKAQFNNYFRENNYPGQYYYPHEYYPGQHYFRNYLSPFQPYFKAKNSQENRSLISTLTITIATSTYTTFVTTSTTCTTSTSWLKSCSPSKGRRRRSQKDISSLLFKGDDEIEDYDADVFFSKSR